MATLIYKQTEEGLEREMVDPLQLWNYLANGWFLNPECTDDGKGSPPEVDPAIIGEDKPRRGRPPKGE